VAWVCLHRDIQGKGQGSSFSVIVTLAVRGLTSSLPLYFFFQTESSSMPKASKRCSAGQDKQNRDRPVHPYSRKALKISKQIVHDKKVESTKSATSVKLEHLAEKLRWFQVCT